MANARPTMHRFWTVIITCCCCVLLSCDILGYTAARPAEAFVSLRTKTPLKPLPRKAAVQQSRYQGQFVSSPPSFFKKDVIIRHDTTRLFAKKKARAKKPSTGGAGFGGAATESCPCGSGLGYMECCGRLHKEPQVYYASATPEQVVRARYSAYAKRQVDFIIQSTHPEHASFEKDMDHWKEQIEKDCNDNFELTKCQILKEEEEEKQDETAQVRFLAHMMQREPRERITFVELSTFKRGGELNAWMYLEGEIETPNEDDTTAAMETIAQE